MEKMAMVFGNCSTPITLVVTDPLSVNSWSLTVMNEVPGPLPVLGAAAAFGYSRRIRRRHATSRGRADQSGRSGRSAQRPLP
jgi:hypothetical protein